MTRLSINRAWDDTRAFIAADRRLIVPVVLAFMILPSVLFRLTAPQADDVQSMMAGQGTSVWAGVLGYVLAFISFIGIFTLILLALGREEPLGQLIGRSARRALVMLGSLILLGLILTPIGLIVLLPFLGGASNPSQLPPTAMGVIGLLMILFLILLFRLFLLFPVAASENLGPWDSLKRGWQLGKGNGLRLIGTFGLLFLGATLVSYVINQVLGTVATIALDGDTGLTVGNLVIGLLAASASAAFQVVQAGMMASYYRQAVSSETV